jgi:hypothetical protein
MPSDFEKKLLLVSGHRAIRNAYAPEIIENQSLFAELIQLCFQFTNKNAPKAFWILELISYDKLL